MLKPSARPARLRPFRAPTAPASRHRPSQPFGGEQSIEGGHGGALGKEKGVFGAGKMRSRDHSEPHGRSTSLFQQQCTDIARGIRLGDRSRKFNSLSSEAEVQPAGQSGSRRAAACRRVWGQGQGLRLGQGPCFHGTVQERVPERASVRCALIFKGKPVAMICPGLRSDALTCFSNYDFGAFQNVSLMSRYVFCFHRLRVHRAAMGLAEGSLTSLSPVPRRSPKRRLAPRRSSTLGSSSRSAPAA